MRIHRAVLFPLAQAFLVTFSLPVQAAKSSAAHEIDRDSIAALNKLYASSKEARKLRTNAKVILVFLTILKAGFGFDAQIGNGALRQNGKTTGYYNTTAASYGF